MSSDGSVRQDAKSGGIDVYGIPPGSIVSLYAHLRQDVPPSVREELRRRGWGFNGSSLEGDESEQRTFSREGYGIARSKVGVWP